MATEHRRYTAGEGTLFRRTKLRISAEQQNVIYESVLDSSQIDIEYVALLTLAGLIALFGLLENSAAVIIGAMLISPLMNPILSAALALLLGDGKMGKRSAAVLAFSVTGVIGITWLVASLTPLKQPTPEILARTAPNLLDLFIAFLSGLAGTLALRGGSVALTILPGVAIAVAVVPPLSVVGYGLSTHQGSIAGGAFLLFVTNLVSIIISAAAVFRVMGFQPQQEAEQGRLKLKYRVGISALVLILLSIPLFLTLRKVAIEVAIRSEVRRELKMAFEADKASVSDLSFSRLRNGLLIQATLRTTRYVESGALHALEDTLRKKFGAETKLLIDQILVTQGGVTVAQASQAQNPISGGIVKPAERNAPFDLKESSVKTLEFVQRDLDALLAGTAIQREAAPEITLASTTTLVLRLQLVSPEPLNSQTISVLASQLASKLGLAIQLHGQIELQGPSFHLTLTPAMPNLGLNADDRIALRKVIKRVQEDNLRLQVTCTSERGAGSSEAIPRVVSEVRRLLSKSGLKNSQWTIGKEPPNESDSRVRGESATVPTVADIKDHLAIAAGQFRCVLKSFQDF
ncbi:MAG: TIGR00341 family protein [Candidatus Acidiferrum sp.]